MDRTPIQVAQAHSDLFTPEFLEYLPANTHVYFSFEREAKRIVARGFAHYRARTIVEVLRHHTALHEVSGSQRKINDHATPYLARLFSLMNPANAGLFEFRAAKAGKGGVLNDRLFR